MVASAVVPESPQLPSYSERSEGGEAERRPGGSRRPFLSTMTHHVEAFEVQFQSSPRLRWATSARFRLSDFDSDLCGPLQPSALGVEPAEPKSQHGMKLNLSQLTENKRPRSLQVATKFKFSVQKGEGPMFHSGLRPWRDPIEPQKPEPPVVSRLSPETCAVN